MHHSIRETPNTRLTTSSPLHQVRNIKYKADNDVEEHKTPVGNVQPVILPVADRGLYAIAEADEKT